MNKLFFSLALIPMLVLTVGCRYNIRDIDPDTPGRVRSIGPESQDVTAVAEKVAESILTAPSVQSIPGRPTIAMLPMVNNTETPFNQSIFTSRVESRLVNSGRFQFLARDLQDDILAERLMKREGEVDYDPNLRTPALMGVDYFLVGRADGLRIASRRGQAQTIEYSFKLVDAETSLVIWRENHTVAREGRDDLIYR
ncbi:MAG: hypothetical protein JJU11_08000 [Candidatus Sumerlaeia bacterium]|nr:hypothetical protein [Candidatus Sumerlaeia bacterium]